MPCLWRTPSPEASCCGHLNGDLSARSTGIPEPRALRRAALRDQAGVATPNRAPADLAGALALGVLRGRLAASPLPVPVGFHPLEPGTKFSALGTSSEVRGEPRRPDAAGEGTFVPTRRHRGQTRWSAPGARVAPVDVGVSETGRLVHGHHRVRQAAASGDRRQNRPAAECAGSCMAKQCRWSAAASAIDGRPRLVADRACGVRSRVHCSLDGRCGALTGSLR